MKFIQTLSINNGPFNNSFGWAAPEYHLMSWALSCLQLQKIYQRVELYSNSNAAKILIDTLELPYHKVNVTHDNINSAHENLWALPKLFTYSLQKEPFLHIDGDVFLFSRLPEVLLSSGLIAQNVEEATNYYAQTQKELMAHFNYFPNCVENDFKNDIPIKAVNAGILGGNNIDFIKEYTDLAFRYINKNVQHFSNINVDRFNVFFEQHLFYSLAKEKNIPIEVLIHLTIKDNQYMHLGDIHEAPCKRSYLHFLGQYKKDEFTCRFMAAKLRQLYPEYYYRIISLFKSKGTPISSNLYIDEKFVTISDYIDFSGKAKKRFIDCSIVENEKKSNFIVVGEEKIKTLVLLKNIINEIKEYNDFSKIEIENDFNCFSKNLLKLLRHRSLNEEYIYGRDLSAVNWYCELFGNESEIENKIISKCDETNIITSTFNWAGLWNKYTRVGVKYYEELELNPDEFCNMVVPEIFGDGFSLQDIDEMEKIILDHLTCPLSINTLFEIMLDYVEDDIIKNHLGEYKELVIVMLKQLVLKKAIKPFKNISNQSD
ncbi:MAG TPA: DUF6734 family protein [Hanamia sp.]